MVQLPSTKTMCIFLMFGIIAAFYLFIIDSQVYAGERKMTLSKTTRHDYNYGASVVFIVGVEGSGHHIWDEILIEMSNSTKHINVMNLSNVVLYECMAKEQWILRHKFKLNTTKTACNIMENEFKFISNSKSHQNGDAIYLLPTASYPFFDNQDNAIPHIPYLMQLSSKYNLALKLIVLKRNWIACVSSACRRYGNCLLKSKLLPSMLSQIQSQILYFNSFHQWKWAIVEYEKLVGNNEFYINGLSSFLQLSGRELIHNSFESMTKKQTEYQQSKREWKLSPIDRNRLQTQTTGIHDVWFVFNDSTHYLENFNV